MLTLSRTPVHQPVWPLGLCADHEEATVWPCELAVAELVRKHGTGWRLAAYLCHLFEQVALLVPTADPLDLRLITIVRPLDAVEAWTRGPRVVEHWRAER